MSKRSNDLVNQPTNRGNSVVRVGFLSILDQGEAGHLGGLLVLNTVARPIEFHCTAPVIPNRAHQILYGSTLRPYLYGERITKALVERVSESLAAVFTNSADVVAAAALIDLDAEPVVDATSLEQPPVIFVPAAYDQSSSADSMGLSGANWKPLSLGSQRGYAAATTDLEFLSHLISRLVDSWDWHEPFERIEQALQEAQRAAA